MNPQVNIEVIHRPNKRERRLTFLAESQRAAAEIAKERSARTKANREKYAEHAKDGNVSKGE